MRRHVMQEVKKKHSELYKVCAWCLGVFERDTSRKVGTLDRINDATSHAICSECKDKQLAKAREVI